MIDWTDILIEAAARGHFTPEEVQEDELDNIYTEYLEKDAEAVKGLHHLHEEFYAQPAFQQKLLPASTQ